MWGMLPSFVNFSVSSILKSSGNYLSLQKLLKFSTKHPVKGNLTKPIIKLPQLIRNANSTVPSPSPAVESLLYVKLTYLLNN